MKSRTTLDVSLNKLMPAKPAGNFAMTTFPCPNPTCTHVFAPETRVFYGLERLWGNAERIHVDERLRTARG